MDVNPDFKELFSILNECRVRYLVVGGHAVAYHAEPRFTKDLDLWMEPSAANAARLWQALVRFGAPLEGVTESDFANPELVYQIGIEPNRVDLMMGLEGVSFSAAWPNRVRSTYGGIRIYVLGKGELVRNKRTVGRPQDLLDARRLTRRAAKRGSASRRRRPRGR